MRYLSVVLALATLVACGEEDDPASEAVAGPSGAARVELDCAPDDGGAFELTVGLTEPSCEGEAGVSEMRIEVWRSPPAAAGVVEFDSTEGLVFYSPADEDSWPGEAPGGKITFDRWDDTAIEGSYEITFDDGTVVEGTFEAPAVCGADTTCG